MSCEDATCEDSEYTTLEGACSTCEEYLVVAPGKRSCQLPSCVNDNNRFKVTPAAECVPCGDYLVPSEDKKSCITPECEDNE